MRSRSISPVDARSNLPRYRSVVFDLDGTLIDSAPVVACILNGMREERGFRPIDLDFYRQWSSVGGKALVGRSLELSEGLVEVALCEFRKRYFVSQTPVDSVFSGARGALEGLVSRGISLAICSNKPERLCHKVLQETGLATFFKVVVGGDTLDERKPSPAPLLHAISELGRPRSECLFIGDSCVDREASIAANVDFALYPSGYDSVAEADRSLRVVDFAEMLDFVEGRS